MFNRLFFILMSFILLVSLVALYYHTESAKKDSVIKTIRNERDNLFITLQTTQKQHQQIAVLDNKHTQELTDAKTQLAALERDVLAGKRRLQLAARCEKLPVTPRPPAWMMLPVPDLTTPLSTIISVSGKE